MNKVVTYLKQTKAEMKQVVWPSRIRVIWYTIIIIVISAALGYAIFGADTLFQSALKTFVGQ
jgi:preprotein translocase SecE subunit